MRSSRLFDALKAANATSAREAPQGNRRTKSAPETLPRKASRCKSHENRDFGRAIGDDIKKRRGVSEMRKLGGKSPRRGFFAYLERICSAR